jgi:hypothetical protein
VKEQGRPCPFNQSIKKEKEMNREVVKEAYELPRIVVRGIVLECGIAVQASMKMEAITQDDWTDSVEESIGGGMADPVGNIGLIY